MIESVPEKGKRMTKEEMINTIEKTLYDLELGSITDRKEQAKVILNTLEKEGMKPPQLENIKCQAIMEIYYAGYTLNMWDEDFIKSEESVLKAYERRKKLEKPKND